MKPRDDYDGPFPKSVFPPSVFPRRIFPWMGSDDEEEDNKPIKSGWKQDDGDDENK